MASLLYLILFLLFVCISYYFTYYPTNKLQAAVMETDRENDIFRKRNEEIPTRSLDAAIFTDASTVVSAQIHLYYNSNIGKIIMSYNGRKYTFNLYDDNDIRTLLPILLLSK
ncbi:entry/fusion complex component [Skunkpox virus]|uniref:Entry-fusion complex protein OPG086 n=1 Tax=Skunkpox virus TaxID=160796 RepID=A0A1C9KBL7_9POXV|nr:entry/fusion complex component [Skunkpox virus]AOP31557.1 entry/fusion complex component [Skunkpox virus]